mgnify:CR=1 FL=1
MWDSPSSPCMTDGSSYDGLWSGGWLPHDATCPRVCGHGCWVWRPHADATADGGIRGCHGHAFAEWICWHADAAPGLQHWCNELWFPLRSRVTRPQNPFHVSFLLGTATLAPTTRVIVAPPPSPFPSADCDYLLHISRSSLLSSPLLSAVVMPLSTPFPPRFLLFSFGIPPVATWMLVQCRRCDESLYSSPTESETRVGVSCTNSRLGNFCSNGVAGSASKKKGKGSPSFLRVSRTEAHSPSLSVSLPLKKKGPREQTSRGRRCRDW